MATAPTAIHNMALRQAQWQSQQWHERSQALTLLDRQHTLGARANSLGHAILQPLTATLLQVQIARRMLQTTSPDVQQVKTSLAQVVQGLRRSLCAWDGDRAGQEARVAHA